MLGSDTTPLVYGQNGASAPVQGQHRRPSQQMETQLEHGRPPVPEKDDIFCQTSRPRPVSLDPTISGNDGPHYCYTNATATSTGSPSTLACAGRRQSFYTTDSGSPVKQQSPLRQSISYDERSDPESLASSFRATVDFANSLIGRSIMSYTGDRKSSGRVSLDRTAAWRRGSGEESQPSLVQPTPTPTRQMKPQAAAGSQVPKSVSPGGSSRFAFFSSSLSALTGATTSSSVQAPNDDELMHLDIHAAIQGQTGDTFSPAAYKNLQMTATGLLEKFQTAYQQRTISCHELKAERNAQSEEKDEAETRMYHLKMQLEDMARRAAEQEATMQSLMEELAQEKRARMEEQRQVRAKGASVSEGSSVSEDLDVDEDQRRRDWRRSAGTVKSDLGCETDDESIEEASVFSRSRSPTIATTITEGSHAELMMAGPQIRTSTSTSTLTTPRNSPRVGQQQQPPPLPQPQISAFQKLFKGIAGDLPSPGTSSCRNCEGQEASVAWDTVNLLKDENRGLKERVGELETAVEGAMDLVNGVAIRAR